MAERLGLLGATSMVGECLLPLLEERWHVTAFTRKKCSERGQNVEWQQLKTQDVLNHIPQDGMGKIGYWICLAPIWTLPAYFETLAAHDPKRIVALSSTSRFTKDTSSEASEQRLARQLIDGEERLVSWAELNGVEWVILRPTLIYGKGRDKNISEIARFILRFGFFPLLGRAMGLRQPVHVEDVAAACAAALVSPVAANRAYNLSGGETLPYREMIGRVFAVLNLRPRLVTVPSGFFRLAVACLRFLPRYRHWTAEMAERMNRDLIFDHTEAARDLGFSSRLFRPRFDDMPH